MDWVAMKGIGKELLKELRVPFVINHIEEPESMDVCFFSLENCTFLENKGKLLPKSHYTRVETDLPGKFLLSDISLPVLITEEETEIIPKGEEKYKVMYYPSITRNEIGDGIKERFLEYTKKIAPIIEKNIKIGIPHNRRKNAPKSQDNWFYIFIWSQSEESNNEQGATPKTMWGILGGCTDSSFLPSGKGFPIITSEDYCIAEVVENALYIHYDICHKDTSGADVIYEKILNEFVTIYNMDSADKKKYLEQVEDTRRKHQESKFVKFVTEKKKKKIGDYEYAISNSIQVIEDYQKSIVAKLQKKNEDELTLLGLKKCTEDMALFSQNEYKKLMKINKVKEVIARTDYIEVRTKNIYIDEYDLLQKNKVIYHIGEFTISIYMDGHIRFYNETNKGKGPGYTLPKGFSGNNEYNRHHPHVNNDGIACLGNLSSVIPKYVADCHLSVLVILLIKFLETVYVKDGAGSGIYWWPVVDKKED